MSPTIRDVPPREQAEPGRLPPRYRRPMQSELLDKLRPLLVPDVAILDVGSGRSPTLAPEDRPSGCHYAGLDVSRAELDVAAGAYSQAIVHDIVHPLALGRSFDVVVSWQVLEHVRPLDAALENLRQVLRPGGTLLAQLSGSSAAFALVSRMMPHRRVSGRSCGSRPFDDATPPDGVTQETGLAAEPPQAGRRLAP